MKYSLLLHGATLVFSIVAFSYVSSYEEAQLLHDISMLWASVCMGFFLIFWISNKKISKKTLESFLMIPLLVSFLPRLYFHTIDCPYTLIEESFKHNHPECRIEIYSSILGSILISFFILNIPSKNSSP